jgi:hypothetical protein
MSSNIEKIIYINLERRKDRREEIEAQLDGFGLAYERFDAIPHEMGIAGCGYSHLAVLRLARDRGYKNVLILEDDFIFLVDKNEFERELDEFFSSGLEYDVFFIAWNVLKKQAMPGFSVGRVLEGQTASAYVVHHTYYDTLIHLFEEAFPKLEATGQHWIYANDQVWKSLQPAGRWYYPLTRLGKQKSGYSDTSNSYREMPF